MILVTGAGGKTGKAVIGALTARKQQVRAFVRSAAHRAATGLDDVVAGEMDDARALAAAVSGVTAIYHICPNVNPREVAFAQALVAAATTKGVTRLVYHSVLHPQIEAMPHHWNKMRVEELLFSTKLDVTILQPTAYMQNILAEWPRILGDGLFRVPYPVETRISLVDLEDVAEVAAEVLTGGSHSGATYELVGTLPVSQIDIADAFGRALRRDVRAEPESIAQWSDRMRFAGMPAQQRDTMSRMFAYYARDGLAGNPNVLHWLLGRAPTSLADFAARMASRD